VASPGASWRISKIANEARRAIESLDLDAQERILAELEGLQANPFLGDVKRIKGKKDIFRLRSGRFRVYFRIIAASRLIEILLFDQRGAIKNKNLQRL
jgi:mRNA-degrading endonuclease RelE of RelBE toxin-antitoxin system